MDPKLQLRPEIQSSSSAKLTRTTPSLASRLTPVTGCPSLSSSSEEEQELEQSHQIDASSGALAGSGTLVGISSKQFGAQKESATLRGNQNILSGKKMSRNRASDQDDQFARQQLQYMNQSNLPTKISITAPSPRGSVREVNRVVADSQSASSQLASRRLQQQQQRQEDQMIERASELSLSSLDRDEGEDSNSGSGTLYQVGCEPDQAVDVAGDKSRSQLIDELLRTINDDSFNDLVDLNNKYSAQASGILQPSASQLANANRPKSAIDGSQAQRESGNNFPVGRQLPQQPRQQGGAGPRTLSGAPKQQQQQQQQPNPSSAGSSTFDNVIRRMSTNFVQNFNKMSTSTLANVEQQELVGVRREKSSTNTNSLYVDNQVPTRRHSDNTINVPRIQVALSSPQTYNSRPNLNHRASVSASKLANKWKLTAKTNRREASDRLSPNLGGALGYMRRHSSGNTTGNEQGHSNSQASSSLFNTSPFKVSKLIACTPVLVR